MLRVNLFVSSKPFDMKMLCRILIAIGRIGSELETVSEIDINPMIVNREGRVVAVDALILLR